MLVIVGAASFAQSRLDLLGPVELPHTLTEFALLGWILYAPRYMRKRVVQAEKSISPLLPDGEAEFHKLFGGVSSIWPPLVGFILFFLLFFLLAIPNTGPGDIAFGLVLSLGVTSNIWTYYSASKGIHDMGRVSLNFTPYFADKFLGLRPVGRLALFLAAAYFAADTIGLLAAITYGAAIYWYGVLGLLIVLGLVFFFLSLFQLHDHMIRHKGLETRKVGEKIGGIFRSESEPGDGQLELARMFKLDMMERRVGSMASWPFDLQTLSRLLVIFISVSAVLLARIIAYYLKLVVPLG